ncbi:MAG: hypothetical protein ACLQBK_00485 [Candidatus Sulfotelmatobacter sp.]
MIQLCGRRVKVQTGAKSQTVNICSSANIHGEYDYKVRLTPPTISEETLLGQSFKSIPELVRYLECHHNGAVEQAPTIRLSGAIQIRSDQTKPARMSRHPLTDLFKSPDVNLFASLAKAASSLSETELQLQFGQQAKNAPLRGEYRDKPYFKGHTGKTTSGLSTNRREEHLAIALWRAYRDAGFALPDGKVLFPVDYQVPLKSHLDEPNAGLGKVDLLSVDAEGEPWICELKVHSTGKKSAETPLKALLEALAYCATLDADLRNLSRESDDKMRMLLHSFSPMRPNLLIMAPTEYWALCDHAKFRDPWREPLQALSRQIEVALKIKVRFVRMDNCLWQMNENTRMPSLIGTPVFNWAWQGRIYESEKPNRELATSLG